MGNEVNALTLREARRRVEVALVHRGYSMTGMWTDRHHRSREDDKDLVTSMALRDLPDVRVIMWQASKGRWEMMMSLQVGATGEFPLYGGMIGRSREFSFIPHHSRLAGKIEDLRQRIRRWDTEKAGALGSIAAMRLALVYLKAGRRATAERLLAGVIRGEIAAATVSEALSIVQDRWARTRGERLRSSQIWEETFK